MEGERSSQTATTTQLHHWQEATGVHQNSSILKFHVPFQGPNNYRNEFTRNLCLV